MYNFEELSKKADALPEGIVHFENVVNVLSNPIGNYRVVSSYRDVFLIINMLDDYIKLLEQQQEVSYSFYTDYMLGQFRRISSSLAEQIHLDKDKMYKKCQKRLVGNGDDTGKDAFALLGRKSG